MATPLARLLPYHARYRVPFWAGIAGLLVARVFEALIPLYLRDGIDAVALAMESPGDGRPPMVDTWSVVGVPTVAIVLCVVARFACIAASRRVIRRIGVAVAFDLRRRIYAHLQLQGARFFGRHPTGDLMARAINDIGLVRQLVGMGTRTILVLLFSAVVGFAFMLTLDLGLTLLMTAPLPAIGLLAWWLSRRVFAASLAVQAGFSTLSERVQENLGGIRTVQALAQEPAEIARFDAVNRAYADRFLDLTRLNSVIAALMPLLGALVTVTIVAYGGSQVLAGAMTLGTFTAFFWYASMVLWPVRQAGQMVTLWQQGASATQRLHEILDLPPEIADAGSARPGPPGGHLRVRDLAIEHRDGVAALQVDDLDIAPGSTVAIVGPIGCGKSTLLRALVRLVDPPPGSVLLDGIDIRDLPLADLRRVVVLVPQDAFLFATDLRENLSYDAARDDDVIIASATTGGLADTLATLPGGLDTRIGERGITLSGGQRQRTALTRGIIRDATVLLLDDCFASVDTRTEDAVLGTLLGLRRGRTTLLVSNRVSTARHADRILVLHDGRLAESGTHAALLAAGGHYARLEQLQSRRGALLDRLDRGDAATAPDPLAGDA